MAIPKEVFVDSFKMFTAVNAHIFKVIHSMDNLWNRTKNVYNNKTKATLEKSHTQSAIISVKQS